MDSELHKQFGKIDIYLFDQLHRDNIRPGMCVLDAGCGNGRNLFYLMRSGYDVSGVDPKPAAIEEVRALAAEVAPHIAPDHFRVETIESLSFEPSTFDVVLVNAVLHFADDDAHFGAMVDGVVRVLRPGGLFFARLATPIGIEDQVESLGGRRFKLPDGTVRFLADEAMLVAETRRLGATLVDPLKTTVVQGLRAMTTWVFRLPK